MSDEKSETILSGLYPPFAEKLRTLLAALGEGWMVSEGFRTFAEQDAYFEQGRSRPGALITRDRAGYSGHCYGTAAHVRPTEPSNEQYFKLATEAKNLDLQWGGNDPTGKFVEMSRVEMAILTMDECLAIFKKGGLPALWATFDAKLGVQPAAQGSTTKEEVAEAGDATEETVEEAPIAGEAAATDELAEGKTPATDSPVVARRKKAATKKSNK